MRAEPTRTSTGVPGATPEPQPHPRHEIDALVDLGRALLHHGYEFVAVSPSTHARALGRRGAHAVDLRDVFGWNRPFDADVLPASMLALLRAAGCCRATADGRLRATVRFATLDGEIFVGSAHPATAHDAVCLGPDSYRFAAMLQRHAPHSRRIVEVRCGSGVGGLVIGARARNLVLADVDPRARVYARVNAELAGLEPEIVHSDVLEGVTGEIDLVVANPPCLLDAHGGSRNGGGELGEGLAVRIVAAALQRLSPGGTLLLHTGTPIVDGCDVFFRAVAPLLAHAHGTACYEELDPDVLGDVLDEPAYVDVERIAAVLLRVTVD